jgi:hypothetical protein
MPTGPGCQPSHDEIAEQLVGLLHPTSVNQVADADAK